ncbi:hypothetical protein FRC11_000585, partial [Ceratobasidium sp. 423]
PKAKTTQAPTKKAIPKTPIVEESSGSDSEPESAPKPKAKPTVVKKSPVASGIALKKAKLLAAKGSSKGSKARIVGKKKVSAR